MAKRNNKDEEVKAQANADAPAETPTDTPQETPNENVNTPAPAEEKKADKPAPINADKMAADIKVSGNSYQQYARQMFKDRLEASR